MADKVVLRGALPGLKPEDARRVGLYLVRGSEVLSSGRVGAGGEVQLSVSREVLSRKSAYGVELVIGPAGTGGSVPSVPNLQRIPLEARRWEKADEVELPLQRIRLTEKILNAWWEWCLWYCVTGTLVGKDGCPVPGADVTVYNVSWDPWAWPKKTPVATATTDATGRFSACFAWCKCPFCWPCWPCYPTWWLCWPWWWEWDILHVIEQIEKAKLVVPPIPGPGPGPVEARAAVLPMARPATADLMSGQAFALSQREGQTGPDPSRTALIHTKLANPAIRSIFPWWWWCCDDPNIVFSATQAGSLVLDENPWADTRWCLANDSSVTLIASPTALTTCSAPLPATGFVWTRVGETTVNNISGGYANGTPGTDYSDLAFAGTLDIYGEFAAASNVSYYQIDAAQWAGPTFDPSRGGTPPAGGSGVPLSVDLYNTVIILHSDGTVTFASVKMGPFSQGGLSNLYATQQQRQSGAAIPSLPPFPTLAATDTVVWAYNGRRIYAQASSLIAGVSAGAVSMSVTGYDAAFVLIALPPNADDTLTLTIDAQPLTTTRINSLHAFTAGGTEVFPSTADTACPAYNIGLGGHVEINVTVQDNNAHIFEYDVEVDYGHGTTGATTPGLRGYRQPGPYPPAPYEAPDVTQKAFGGGTETFSYTPAVNCCYDFRLNVGKRVTDGTYYPGLYTADFWTATINVS